MNEDQKYKLSSDTKTNGEITESGILFLEEASRIQDFILYVFNLSNFRLKHTIEQQKRYLFRERLTGTIDDSTSNKKPTDTKNLLIEHFENQDEFLAEMIFCRMVDNFLVYISNLLSNIFKTKPETLRSGEQERLDFILSHNSIEELISSIADKRVEKLSMQGLNKLIEYFENLGFKLFETQEEIELINLVVEIRNVIVHNRGIINNIFKKRVPKYPLEKGEKIKLSYDAANAFSMFIANSVFDIDDRAAKKFNLIILVRSTTSEL